MMRLTEFVAYETKLQPVAGEVFDRRYLLQQLLKPLFLKPAE